MEIQDLLEKSEFKVIIPENIPPGSILQVCLPLEDFNSMTVDELQEEEKLEKKFKDELEEFIPGVKVVFTYGVEFRILKPDRKRERAPSDA